MSTETMEIKVYYNWLRIMYAYTLVLEGPIELTSLTSLNALNVAGYSAEPISLLGACANLICPCPCLSVAY